MKHFDVHASALRKEFLVNANFRDLAIQVGPFDRDYRASSGTRQRGTLEDARCNPLFDRTERYDTAGGKRPGKPLLFKEQEKAMKLVTGKVVGGKVVVDAGTLEEGTTVTVVAPGLDETFTVDAREESELLGAIRAADAEDFVDGDEFLRQFPNHS